MDMSGLSRVNKTGTCGPGARLNHSISGYPANQHQSRHRGQWWRGYSITASARARIVGVNKNGQRKGEAKWQIRRLMVLENPGQLYSNDGRQHHQESDNNNAEEQERLEARRSLSLSADRCQNKGTE